ncbi:hypothetical protein Bbelb_042420 [Branchiostoma belcheri]|nr:hypothetical protein Bbelb_042420 [Branchiostoma belcheri]
MSAHGEQDGSIDLGDAGLRGVCMYSVLPIKDWKRVGGDWILVDQQDCDPVCAGCCAAIKITYAQRGFIDIFYELRRGWSSEFLSESERNFDIDFNRSVCASESSLSPGALAKSLNLKEGTWCIDQPHPAHVTLTCLCNFKEAVALKARVIEIRIMKLIKI